jgi:hypothetical protein
MQSIRHDTNIFYSFCLSVLVAMERIKPRTSDYWWNINVHQKVLGSVLTIDVNTEK